MKIAVTGKLGQISMSLIDRGAAAGHEVVALGRPELDLVDPLSVTAALTNAAPDVIISAAAYTAVDKAEADRETAFAVNAAGAGAVAHAATILAIPLVHLSTDYVFDGMLDRPYLESDPSAPGSVYGASKLLGEHAVFAAHENSVVLRIAWVYSPFGTNFVKTMLRIAEQRDELSVVADQFGNPTSALDIADALVRIAENLVADERAALRGLFHMTAQGEASWADLAQVVFSRSATYGGPTAAVRRIQTVEYPTPAPRPRNSRLNSSAISKVHGITLPDWRLSLDATVARLLSK